MFSPIKNLLNTKKAQPADGAAPAEAKVKAKKAASKGIFLDGDDARGFKSEPEPKPATAKSEKAAKAAAPAKAATPAKVAAPTPMIPAATIAAAVTVPVAQPAVSAAPYQQFPTRRRPGANMKGFLEMAQQVKKVQA
jgi:large subunit ribosomal protein L22e